jgi:hypothetical protein
MNLKKIIREEIDDLDWIRNVSYEDLLDDYYGIETDGEEAWFKDITDRDNIRPADDMYKELAFTKKGDLYNIIYNDKIWKLDRSLIKRLRIGSKLDNWRMDRLDKLMKYYPRMVNDILKGREYY